jgi:hypothetical protein
MALGLMVAIVATPDETVASTTSEVQSVEAGYFPAQFPQPAGAPEAAAPTF